VSLKADAVGAEITVMMSARIGAVPRRVERDERGFTLIELMVVVLIIAVLVAIGLPTLLGARQRAQNSAAKSLIRNALSTEIVFYGSSQTFSGDNSAGGELDSIDPSVEWGTLTATDSGVIATVSDGDATLILRSQSVTGTTYCLGRIGSGAVAGTYYTTECDGAEDTAAVSGWGDTPATGGW